MADREGGLGGVIGENNRRKRGLGGGQDPSLSVNQCSLLPHSMPQYIARGEMDWCESGEGVWMI